jgi:DNA polymerase-3 subunit delta'
MSVYENLVGQDHITAILKAAVEASRTGVESQEMTHAWVFTGPPGSGRSSAAVAFAQALVCPNQGCGACNECRSAFNGSHPDVEIIRTEGLSIKVEEVRELLTRVAWAPSMGGWRVVVMEDADRLTESAANALLNVLPTIRSRCRHIQLHTPSDAAVAQVLMKRDGITPAMAEFAARVSQGHIGRAKYLALNESVRSNRTTIMHLPLQLNSLAAAFKAAQTLVDLATTSANAAAEVRDEKEIAALQEAYGKGATGRGMATGAAKAVKELEKEQKSRATRMVRDSIDGALLDIATFYRDVMMVQSGSSDAIINTDMVDAINAYAAKHPKHTTINKMSAIMEARTNLAHNAAPLLTCEALFCRLAKA